MRRLYRPRTLETVPRARVPRPLRAKSACPALRSLRVVDMLGRGLTQHSAGSRRSHGDQRGSAKDSVSVFARRSVSIEERGGEAAPDTFLARANKQMMRTAHDARFEYGLPMSPGRLTANLRRRTGLDTVRQNWLSGEDQRNRATVCAPFAKGAR